MRKNRTSCRKKGHNFQGEMFYKSLRFILISCLLLGVTFFEVSVGVCSPASEKENFRDANLYPLLKSERWMGIYFNGAKLGFNYSALYEGEAGYKTVLRAVVRLEAMGQQQEISFNQEAFLTKNLRTLGFDFLQTLSSHSQSIVGDIHEGVAEITITSSGAVSKKSMPFPSDTISGGVMDLVLVKKGLRVGASYPVKIFMESLQSIVDLTITVVGKEELDIGGKKREVYKVEQKYMNLTAYAWVTPDGETLKELSLEGLESYVEDEEKALKFTGSPLSFSTLLTFSLVRSKKELSEPRKIGYLKAKLKGLSSPSLFPAGERQRVLLSEEKNDGSFDLTIEVRREHNKNFATVEEIAGYLQPTSVIQSDYPEIQEKAKEIIGSETDPSKKAKKISEWVFNYLDKKPMDTFSAVDALHSKEGECQSHANLFAALARSVGIPAKIASGLVYVKEYNGFLYHAWAEAYDNGWTAFDPTFGQTSVDATHIKLVEGGLEKQIKLLHFIGKVGIDIIGTEAGE